MEAKSSIDTFVTQIKSKLISNDSEDMIISINKPLSKKAISDPVEIDKISIEDNNTNNQVNMIHSNSSSENVSTSFAKSATLNCRHNSTGKLPPFLNK